MVMNYKAVIFDLDGTLLDTLGDLTDSMNFALNELGMPKREAQECRMMIGNGVVKFAERALPDNRKDCVEEVLQIMKAHYIDNCCNKTRPFEGILELLEKLRKMGVKLAVLTNKQHDQALKTVDYYFNGFFNEIAGITAERKIKPDPESTLEICSKMNIEPSQALFVGDSDVDMETAGNAGILPVGVSWGFREAELLKKAGAQIIVDKPAQILDLIS